MKIVQGIKKYISKFSISSQDIGSHKLFYFILFIQTMRCVMCTQDIVWFNIIVCPIFFVQKCWHVLYIIDLKVSFSHMNVFIVMH
jgi:hypothetical protein